MPRRFLTLLLLSIASAVVGPHGGMAQTRFNGTTMGPIEYNVMIYDEFDDVGLVESGIRNRLDQVNQLMSTYIKSSDVSRFNQAKEMEWVEVDPLTAQVVSRSLELSEQTGGTFDITVGPAVAYWKFGADTGAELGSLNEIEPAVGFENIQIQKQPPAIRKTNAKTWIDLSAIAKGFAVDQVANELRNFGLENFMVEVGGEVTVIGETPKGKWRIGIEQPKSAQRSVSTVALLSNQSLATSGDYRSFRIENGKRISHTIDPTTCQPVENDLASCSIVAGDCMTADAVATAIMVMGAIKGGAFCDDNGYQYTFIRRNESDDSRWVTESSQAFPMANKTSSASSDSASIWPAFAGALIVFSLAIAGMAVGAVFNNRPITGSCGGIAANQNEDGSSSCSMCQKPVTDCPEQAEPI